MPSAELVHRVLRLSQDGMKRRAIARALHISRNTVKDILAKHDHLREVGHSALPPVKTSSPRPSQLDVHRGRVEELLRTYPDITAQRVFEILRGEAEFPGGYSIVKTLVRRLRPPPKPTPSYETAPRVPGEMAECDWSPIGVPFTHGPKMDVEVFGYTLRYSTRKYYSFHQSNGLQPLLNGHQAAFDRFQGLAHRCRYDSQKPVVLRWEGAQPIYNPRFIDFATYCEFIPEACRLEHPNDKPRVERSFAELFISFFRGRSFRDFDDLCRQLVSWMDQIADLRPLKRMRRKSRLELFAEEQPLLRPVPRHPYDTARVLYKLCDIEGFIAYEGNWYSLPYDYVTDLLPVRVTEHELFVYRTDLKLIARHPLFARGAQQRSVLEGHRPRMADRGPDLDHLRQTFAGLGDVAAAYLAALEKHEPRSAGYHARQVLLLREGFTSTDLIAALQHGLAYGALRHDAIARILIARSHPRRLDEYVAERTAQKLKGQLARSSTEPRDLTEYDALPCPTSPPPSSPSDSPCPSAPPPPDAAQDLPSKPKTGSSNTSNGSD